MEESSELRISAGAAMRDGFVSLLKPPFRGLLVLALLIAFVIDSLPVQGDDATVAASLVLFGISLYIQIATILAAAQTEPSPSMDSWIKQAVRQRCFWRFFGAAVMVLLTVVASGIVGVVVGAFVVGGIVALTDAAVVLERRGPLDAIARSSELGKGSRGPLMLIFGLLILIPGVTTQVASFIWNLPKVFGDFWPVVTVVVLVLGFVGSISLTRAFIRLGGKIVPLEPKNQLSA